MVLLKWLKKTLNSIKLISYICLHFWGYPFGSCRLRLCVCGVWIIGITKFFKKGSKKYSNILEKLGAPWSNMQIYSSNWKLHTQIFKYIWVTSLNKYSDTFWDQNEKRGKKGTWKLIFWAKMEWNIKKIYLQKYFDPKTNIQMY